MFLYLISRLKLQINDFQLALHMWLWSKLVSISPTATSRSYAFQKHTNIRKTSRGWTLARGGVRRKIQIYHSRRGTPLRIMSKVLRIHQPISFTFSSKFECGGQISNSTSPKPHMITLISEVEKEMGERSMIWYSNARNNAPPVLKGPVQKFYISKINSDLDLKFIKGRK